ncbi:hypothetical protein LSAT2_018233, partial [Lamellibrachia satsuma]
MGLAVDRSSSMSVHVSNDDIITHGSGSRQILVNVRPYVQCCCGTGMSSDTPSPGDLAAGCSRGPIFRTHFPQQFLISTSSTSSQTWSAPALHPPRPGQHQLYILPDLVSTSPTSSQTWSAPALHPPRPSQHQPYILPDLVSTSPTSSQT